MKPGQQYTDPVRVHAVAKAELVGSERAGKELGIPGRTIRGWMSDPALAALRQKTRDEISEDIRVAEALAWDLIIARLRGGDIASRDLVILAGVATDKAQLLTGAATARNENRDITGTLTDAELRDTIREAERLVARASPEAAGAPEG